MTLRRIEIFIHVAKHLSYTRAAQELYLSQPAVTKNIQALEKELDTRLFNRSGNNIELTKAGELTYSYGVDILRQVQDFKTELSSITGKIMGHLNIGASSTISQYILPPIIAKYQKQHANVDISLLSGNTSFINTHLRDDNIDVGVTEGDRKINNFNYHTFINDEIAFVGSVNRPAALPPNFSQEQLKEVPLVIREPGSGTREVFEEAIDKLGYRLSDLNIAVTLGSTESIKSYILNSDVLGVFSTAAIDTHANSKFDVYRIDGHPITRQFSFILKQGAQSKLAQNFIKYCNKTYNLSE